MGSATSKPAERKPLVVTSVKIERDKLDLLKDIAAQNRRSVSQELRWLIDRAVEQAEDKAAA